MQRGRTARNVATLVEPPAARRPTIALPLTVDEPRRVLQAVDLGRNAGRWVPAPADAAAASMGVALGG